MTKRVLITGKNSYVGNQLAEWLNKEPETFEVVKLSMRNDKWKEIDFSRFDVIVHVAGIAHQDTKADQKELYYKVNTDLTVKIAAKAKSVGVKQFIFLSSMIVYGASSKIGEQKIITKETIPKPINFYGHSKLLAEEGILSLQSKKFNVVVLRPPMIYGKGSKGNYPILSRFAKQSPIFLNFDNQRSMLYIDNLSELIRLIIKNTDRGIFYPQNKEYVKTSEMVKTISIIAKKRIKLIKVPLKILNVISKRTQLINKIFGNLVYEKNMSKYKVEYNVTDFFESISKTEE